MRYISILLIAVLLSSCVAKKVHLESPGLIGAATVNVKNPNPTLRIAGQVFFTLLTLGLWNFQKSPFEKVVIRTVNGRDAQSASVIVDPGECDLGLIYQGPKGRKSKGMVNLAFKAAPNTTYTVWWKANSEEWSATLEGLQVFVEGKGEIMTPMPYGTYQDQIGADEGKIEKDQ